MEPEFQNILTQWLLVTIWHRAIELTGKPPQKISLKKTGPLSFEADVICRRTVDTVHVSFTID